jgi:hypothetical protein
MGGGMGCAHGMASAGMGLTPTSVVAQRCCSLCAAILQATLVAALATLACSVPLHPALLPWWAPLPAHSTVRPLPVTPTRGSHALLRPAHPYTTHAPTHPHLHPPTHPPSSPPPTHTRSARPRRMRSAGAVTPRSGSASCWRWRTTGGSGSCCRWVGGEGVWVGVGVWELCVVGAVGWREKGGFDRQGCAGGVEGVTPQVEERLGG